MRPRGPAAGHGIGDFRMELEGIGGRTVTHRLDGEIVAGGQSHRTGRAIETFAMPVIDMIRPGRAKALLHAEPGMGRRQRIITDLGAPFFMRIDPRSQMPGHDLRAEAQAEVGLALLQWYGDPVGLAPDEVLL